MSDIAIQVCGVSKVYRIFKTKRHQVLDLLGFPLQKKNFDEFWALRDFDLVVQRGEKIGLIGHNGAGKSTLLKIIAAQVAPTVGRVTVNGKVQALMELGTGFHPEFTGRENVFSALGYQGIVGAAARTRFDEIVDFSELEEFIDNPVKTYSAGMYARIAFSVATAIEPEILIIDEVLGAGDAYFAGKCVDRMNDITQRAGATILFVSHDMSSLLRLCDRAVWLKKGRSVLDGPAHEVVKEYIDAMRYETELRHRSREMQLSKGMARMLMTSDDVFKKLLLRFRVDGDHPRYRHLVRRLAIYRREELLGHIDVGDAMDNGQQEQSYLISGKDTTDWSESMRMEQGFGRYYCDCGGTEPHAPFVLAVPYYLKDSLADMELVIEGELDSRETVFVELWDDSGHYNRIGAPSSISDGTYRIPLNPDEGAAVDVHPQTTLPKLTSPVRRATEDEFSADRVVAIERVELLDSLGESKRVFPMGASVSVVIEYEAHREVADPVFAVTFHRVDGIQMDHQNTRLLGEHIRHIQGVGVARFSFSPLRLGPGEYFITVAILKYLDIDNWIEQPPSYDRHDRRYAITIFSTLPSRKSTGVVLQDCTFTLN
jgi:lipopolysaccharide transport system ATP-binding protein